ncbi:MAG: Na+/H+ antiporter subunit D, partial [Candidatus Omnitrophica bacterium]|nr:Na+/H+ antiporter subunit D [Candidatus Omnitrophota bacterium]
MNLLVTPIVLPLAGAALCLLFSGSSKNARWISGGATLLTVAFAGKLFLMADGGEVSVLRVGGWPESYGIV